MADITFLSAPIGGGKSLFACRAILEELAKSDRMVVTNVPMRLEREKDDQLTVAEWCHLYVKGEVDINKRLLVLTHEQVKEFFRWYPDFSGAGNGAPWLMPMLMTDESKGKDGVYKIPDLQCRMQLQKDGRMPRGCFFVIDEVHLYFSAREWSEHGVGIEKYMSQLRKLNDDLFLVTQHPEKVDKNFRRNATEWIYLRNFSRTKLAFGVTLPGRFRFQKYVSMAQKGDKPFESGWLQLKDRQYQKCYDTMAGVGLSGGLMPEGSRMKGRHWSIYIVVFCVVVVGVYLAARGMTYGFGAVNKSTLSRYGLTSKAGAGAGSNGLTASVGGLILNRAGLGQGLPVEAPVNDYISPVWSREVFVDAFQIVGGVPTVFLTDETHYTLGDGHFILWKNNVALIDNVYYRVMSLSERARFESRGGSQKGSSDTTRRVLPGLR